MRLLSGLMLFFFCLSVAFPAANAEDKEICMYTNAEGVIRTVKSRDKVPAAFVGSVKCMRFKAESRPKLIRTPGLASPDKVRLGPNIRREILRTELGEIEVRFPRSVQTLFGRSPIRAVTAAAKASAKAISRFRFPAGFNTRDLPWKFVFMDENLPEDQIPVYLRQNCHRGWMTPPANVYLVSDRIARRCGDRQLRESVADGDLAAVLIHEIGHVLEYELQGKRFYSDRIRAEGFATWFASFASDFTGVISSGSVRDEHLELARKARERGESSFSGTASDYARASVVFHAIVDRRGTSGLYDVYEELRRNGGRFLPAVKSELGWGPAKIEEESRRILR